ncbi:MAG: 2-amino-4-hydroxy-6-hydroxymethyldihydropteridine diphosphokinase [Candidatus Nephthysia bennettiae]|uniref:2-amino-4-hydroxy-6-hydroxymethyldihydropteridine diphosphokinase n=1 Tax=Candidatus Nephthysia bennettiae TaxID=3127016 RepID=A0A934K8W8_9BACT|nr:2-amino-4-hydroxy-6-hydroxymethyldihydropteridine diphosphokinase [Candidatus Dormibacteraeota bacterium]MBJ7612525.1 2-amino-4-hydroxy-6-hydroxymethyldihydropteridine diphosphokinase [Candidatus Dormibacteraeota bacterium]PZR94466.1 MAG: 2-amino-4-hydroxy-6-hydroxymethyldihydropteridine diphosphokinase [Candidatus Dormibacteraeota bacterium]
MTRAYLALGSNLGDREAYLAAARRLLPEHGVGLVRESSVLETEPFGVTDQPAFLNQVLEVEWSGSPRDLLGAVKAVESEAGRKPTYRWGPRELDVDILTFGSETVTDGDLTIPHPGLADRRFLRQLLRELLGDVDSSSAGKPNGESEGNMRG